MRVIAGKFKGHRLSSFSAAHLRPTMDRVKGSIFNILMNDIPEARVLDLFSGTGALAIEALSRGAAEVVAVENHPRSLAILRENLAKLKIATGIEVHPVDVFKFLARHQGPAFSVVLADPPFTKKIADSVLQALAKSRVVAPGSLVVIEAGAHETVADEYAPLRLKDRRDFGDKTVSIFTCS